MDTGGKFLVSAAVLAVGACTGESGKLEIRSTPTALAPGEHPVSFRVAEARGQLAIGNVALALEGFRKAWREDPNSVVALAGMADCYDRMGRFDLSRRNYEAALALAPSNLDLLGALASSLDQQGDRHGAGKVRQEIALRAAAAKVQAVAVAQNKPVETAEAELVRIVAPAAAVDAAPAPIIAAAVPASKPTPVTEVMTVLKSVQVVAPVVAVAAPVIAITEAIAAPPTPALAPKEVAASTLTVKLPQARSSGHLDVEAVTFAAQSAELEPPTLPAKGPHLERLSMGEIALVSAPTPMWRPTTIVQPARSTKVRFIPLREASTVPVQVRLLNAARVNRLAARTQSWLVARGWQGLGIGDADRTRAHSVILYPAGKRALAQTLSSQFGFAIKQGTSGSQITVLLGRDAARHPAFRPVRG
jgi:Flp pilus assembly protein TadD